MGDLILIDGDLAMFMPAFGPATVSVRPGRLRGSGPARLGRKAICVDGDETALSVPACAYVTPQFSIPGSGTLKIERLASSHRAGSLKTGGKPVLVKGGQFNAAFEVQSPAQQPAPSGSPLPDPTPKYSGQGRFVTTNAVLRTG